VTQTDGEGLPQFSVIAGEPGDLTPKLRQVITQQGVELRYEDSLGGASGVSEGGRIAVLTGLEPAEEFAVLTHELAHELLQRTERRKETTRSIRELEAEAVAFVVFRKRCLNYTLKTRAKLFLGERISHETQESRGWHAGAKSGRRIGGKW
jgi:hypothetical protein